LPPDELSIIHRFLRPLAGEGALEFRDDAALLRVPPDCDLVVTADMLAVGVHFLPDDPPGTIGRKALRVNLSDLAAKGADPLGYLLSAGWPANLDEGWLAAFVSGLAEDQERFGIGLLGGDTIEVVSGPVISVTALGSVPRDRMVHRFGGRPGDALYVSGAIGAGAAGLALLKGRHGPWNDLSLDGQDILVARFRVPEPRLGLAPALRDFASAAMDVSDGLIGDCDKLAAASGCTASIEAEWVPLPAGLDSSGSEALLAALLTAGDDYEVLAAVPPANAAAFETAAAAAGIPVTRIGELRGGHTPSEVLWRGRPLTLARRSWVHGRAEATT
jgi:thiamine-monophosphate kinase